MLVWLYKKENGTERLCNYAEMITVGKRAHPQAKNALLAGIQKQVQMRNGMFGGLVAVAQGSSEVERPPWT